MFVSIYHLAHQCFKTKLTLKTKDKTLSLRPASGWLRMARSVGARHRERKKYISAFFRPSRELVDTSQNRAARPAPKKGRPIHSRRRHTAHSAERRGSTSRTEEIHLRLFPPLARTREHLTKPSGRPAPKKDVPFTAEDDIPRIARSVGARHREQKNYTSVFSAPRANS